MKYNLNLKIKGFSNIFLNEEVLRISNYVGLQKDLKTMSKSLSGGELFRFFTSTLSLKISIRVGMKRRLSVAMSFIGDSKVIILGKFTYFVRQSKDYIFQNFYF